MSFPEFASIMMDQIDSLPKKQKEYTVVLIFTCKTYFSSAGVPSEWNYKNFFMLYIITVSTTFQMADPLSSRLSFTLLRTSFRIKAWSQLRRSPGVSHPLSSKEATAEAVTTPAILYALLALVRLPNFAQKLPASFNATRS